MIAEIMIGVKTGETGEMIDGEVVTEEVEGVGDNNRRYEPAATSLEKNIK
jgi:hypothetical protein